LTEVNKGRLTLNQYVKVASEKSRQSLASLSEAGRDPARLDGDITVVDMDKEGTMRRQQAAQQEQTVAVAWLERLAKLWRDFRKRP